MAKLIERCVDCVHYGPCKEWAKDCFGEDTEFPYEAPENLCVHFMPATNVAPVVHARWKESDFIPGMLTCTNCGVQRNPKFKLGGGAWNRCPNCGAKMDLEQPEHLKPAWRK